MKEHTMKRTLTRTLIGAAALSGALTFGAAGIASGATTGTGTSSGSGSSAPASTHTVNCARAEKLATRVQTLETKANTWLPKAAQREAAAKTADHPKLAALIGRRIARVEKLMPKGEKLLAKIAQKCGTAAPAS
jgi:hypothetical protein